MAADLIQKIHASSSAPGGDSQAAVDVPQDGMIESIYYNCNGVSMDALNDSYSFELSFASSNTFGTNDSRVSILDVSERQQFLTSGGGAPGVIASLININIPVFAGERLHVHTQFGGGTASMTATIYLYYNLRGRGPARRSLRRL